MNGRHEAEAGAASSRILSWIDASYWMMHPPAFESMRGVVASWAQAPGAVAPLSRAEKDAAIAAAQAARPAPAYQAPSTIVVLSMFGVISPRSNMCSDLSQEGCSLDVWSAKYRSVMQDSNVAGVIVNVDSPGGNVYQVPETADLIYSLRHLKPNVGVVTGMSASAGYFLATQFEELVCGGRSTEVGSIGVLMRHQDLSKMASDAGVATTYITSPRDGNKAEGNPFTPLSDATKEYFNTRTDAYYEMFLAALARGRRMAGKGATATIDQEWGRGRLLGADRALELGMVDRISTLQVEIDLMAQKARKPGNGARADGQVDRYRAKLQLA
jgi:signal peptide peptidase SppA